MRPIQSYKGFSERPNSCVNRNFEAEMVSATGEFTWKNPNRLNCISMHKCPKLGLKKGLGKQNWNGIWNYFRNHSHWVTAPHTKGQRRFYLFANLVISTRMAFQLSIVFIWSGRCVLGPNPMERRLKSCIKNALNTDLDLLIVRFSKILMISTLENKNLTKNVLFCFVKYAKCIALECRRLSIPWSRCETIEQNFFIFFNVN